MAGEIEIPVFCVQFESSYNFHTEKAELTSLELNTFDELFEKVVWYSPYPDEREHVPSYLGEVEIETAIRHAASRLGVMPPAK
jgi:hypothetical protein